MTVSSLAPSKEEQEERFLLLREEKLNKRSQENRDQSWKHSEFEKFLSSDTDLPSNVKEQLQAKMTKLAEEFLNDNF